MSLYFPSMDEVFVYRSRSEPPQYATFVLRGREADAPLPVVVIDGEEFEYAEHATDRTRMVMRHHAIQRHEAEQRELQQSDGPAETE